jgi:hypothetical protein
LILVKVLRRVIFWKNFLLACALCSHSLAFVFRTVGILNFNRVRFIDSFFHQSCAVGLYLKHHQTQGRVAFLLLLSRSLISLHFTLQSMIQSQLVFWKEAFKLTSYSCCQSSSTISWKNYLCSSVLPWLLGQSSVDYMSLFLGLLFCSTNFFVLSS